ncbi:MAG: helix-hairpin-helix domain-containing protein, partial [Nitrospiria bacterium]
VQSIVRELKGEKIDIVTWTDDPRTYIGEALSPAVIEKVGINEAENTAMVVVSDQQLSLAIGKKGQNVRLASKLTGWKIDIINQGEYENERAKEREQEIAAAISHEQKLQQDAQILEEQRQGGAQRKFNLCDLPGVGEKVAEVLIEHGIDSVEKLAETNEAALCDLPMIGMKTAAKIIEGAKEHLK